MDLDFSDKGVVVTGAAKGVGEAIVRAFHKEGARVALLDIDEGGKDLAAELGSGASFFKVDISKAAGVEKVFHAISRDFGAVQILVNNAGIQTYGTVTETTEELWDRTLNINLKGSFLCAKAALPLILQAGGGVVINVSSLQALLSQPNVAAYTTSKTALLGLTRSIAVDYAPKVRCVAVCPGTIDTPMLRWAVDQSPNPEELLENYRKMHPVQRIARPEEVADLVLFLASDKAGFITGQYYRIDGGLGITIVGERS